VERQIGRILERSNRTASLFTVTVTGNDRLSIDIRKNEERFHRTQTHILVCFLSLVMWRILQQWMKASGLGTAPRKLLTEMNQIQSLDVLLPAKDKTIRLRVVATVLSALKVLLLRMKILLPNKPKIIENVVEKNTPF
jgi:hypothetical protein